MGLGWEREQKVPVMCFRGILRGLGSLFTSHLQKSLVSLKGLGLGLQSSGTFMRRSKDVELPRPSSCWQSQLFLTSRKSFLIFVNSHDNHVWDLALGASKTGLTRECGGEERPWDVKRGPWGSWLVTGLELPVYKVLLGGLNS